jgi:hypothetical protein
MKPSEVLNKAADYIEEHGWARLAFETEDGKVCISGGINRACGSTDALLYDGHIGWRPKNEAREALTKHLGRNFVEWNDLVAQSADDVLHELRICAKGLDAEGR